MPSRVIATSISLIAFAAALLAGISAGNELTPVLSRALMVMMVTYFAGAMIGTVAQIAIDEHIADYKKRYPLESPPVVLAKTAEPVAEIIDEDVTPAIEEASELGSIADHQPTEAPNMAPEAVAA